MSDRALRTMDPDEHNLFSNQCKSSSALSFARSLFHAAEGRELFEDEFVFASAVSTYYSLFHLGAALMLAYFSQPVPTEVPHAEILRRIKKRWREGHRNNPAGDCEFPFPDPAQGIGHDDVPRFLQHELPEISQGLGCRGQPGTLRDMREFANYAPRMLSDGHQNVLYSGCQYTAQDFKGHLIRHVDRIDELFRSSVRWTKEQDYSALYSRVLSGAFILFEFSELGRYYPKSLVKRAWVIYRSVCEHEGADWRIWRGARGVLYLDEQGERERYAEAIQQFES